MRRWMMSALVVVMAALGSFLTLYFQPRLNDSGHLIDVSWPNCRAVLLPGNRGIVGVTGGLDFRPNPCLAQEAAAFPVLELYMNSGWPGVRFYKQFPASPQQCLTKNADCLAYNYGYHAAMYALGYARSRLVRSNIWWIDVETENSWTTSIRQNRLALEGMVAALHVNQPRAEVGFYSFPGQWRQIVGNWRPFLPAWIATGSSQAVAARQACRQPSFTARHIVLSQYTLELDQDIIC